MNRVIGMIVALVICAMSAKAAAVSLQVGTGPFDTNGGSPPLVVGAVYDAGYIGKSIWRAELAASGWRFWGSDNYYSSCTHIGKPDLYGFGLTPRLVLDLPIHPKNNNSQIWVSFGGGVIFSWWDRIESPYSSWTETGVSILGKLNFRTGETESFYLEAEHQGLFDDTGRHFDLIMSAGYRFRAF